MKPEILSFILYIFKFTSTLFPELLKALQSQELV
jgi:hypothetical protein